jgi:hypothetical protein
MIRLILAAPLLLGLLVAGPAQAAKTMAAGQEKPGAMALRPVPQTADWQKLSSLVGRSPRPGMDVPGQGRRDAADGVPLHAREEIAVR